MAGETGETWMPEGVTVVERHWNQAMSAIVLVYSADANCYHHVVACLGCHFSAVQDPDSAYSARLKLTDASRIATEPQQLAVDRPDVFVVQRSEYDHTTFYYYVVSPPEN
ncbi:hypothetical protein [Streptomyces hygroscopicus]|uniref:hypothetical protein n=1 Tax=Streptomyces hygroscopicus TaxID=1912 RepID=UPI0033DA09D2